METFFMLPAYSELILNMGVEGMAIVLAVEGLGATAAALWMARGSAELATHGRVMWSAPIAIIAAAALICTVNLYAAVVISVVLGIASEIRKTGTMTIVQLGVDENQRGRVMGTWFIFAQIAGGIGAYGIGQAAVAFGLKLPTVIFAGLCLAVWLVIYINRRRLIDRRREAPEDSLYYQ
jgi:predicted MFS family arabinose efflux permease